MKKKKISQRDFLKIWFILFVVAAIFYVVQVRNFAGLIITEIEQKQEIEYLKTIIKEGGITNEEI